VGFYPCGPDDGRSVNTFAAFQRDARRVNRFYVAINAPLNAQLGAGVGNHGT
jgi:hypothetical protein